MITWDSEEFITNSCEFQIKARYRFILYLLLDDTKLCIFKENIPHSFTPVKSTKKGRTSFGQFYWHCIWNIEILGSTYEILQHGNITDTETI